jgi:hypothetical protein
MKAAVASNRARPQIRAFFIGLIFAADSGEIRIECDQVAVEAGQEYGRAGQRQVGRESGGRKSPQRYGARDVLGPQKRGLTLSLKTSHSFRVASTDLKAVRAPPCYRRVCGPGRPALRA